MNQFKFILLLLIGSCLLFTANHQDVTQVVSNEYVNDIAVIEVDEIILTDIAVTVNVVEYSLIQTNNRLPSNMSKDIIVTATTLTDAFGHNEVATTSKAENHNSVISNTRDRNTNSKNSDDSFMSNDWTICNVAQIHAINESSALKIPIDVLNASCRSCSLSYIGSEVAKDVRTYKADIDTQTANYVEYDIGAYKKVYTPVMKYPISSISDLEEAARNIENIDYIDISSEFNINYINSFTSTELIQDRNTLSLQFITCQS